MKFHQLNAEQQIDAVEQIAQIESDGLPESEQYTTEMIDDMIADGENPDEFYNFEIISDNLVNVTRK